MNTEIVDSGLLKDRKKSLKTYKAAFEWNEFVQWLTAHSNCGSRQGAEETASLMLGAGFIEVRFCDSIHVLQVSHAFPLLQHVRGDFTVKDAPYPWFHFNANRVATISAVSCASFIAYTKEASKNNNKRTSESAPYAQMPPPRKAVTKN